MGPMGFPETSVNNYECMLRNIPEERRSHFHRGGSLTSRTGQIRTEPLHCGCSCQNLTDHSLYTLPTAPSNWTVRIPALRMGTFFLD